MIYVRPLTDDERRLRRRLARTDGGRVGERMGLVLLSSRGYAVPQIAAIVECDEATGRTWLARVEGEGVGGRRDRPRPGRPRTADAAARDARGRALARAPAACGYLAGDWTVARRAAHLAAAGGRGLSPSTGRRARQALGVRGRRPRHLLPRDPAAAATLGALAAPIWQATAEPVVLGEDASDLPLRPGRRAMWMRRGPQGRVPTPGGNRKRAGGGARDPASGRWPDAVTARTRAVAFVAFLEHVRLAYPGRPLRLIVDNASIHTAKLVRAWLVDHPQVALGVLPPDRGPHQNPVEKVWWRRKGRVAANRRHGSVEIPENAVHAFFASFTPEDARRLAA